LYYKTEAYDAAEPLYIRALEIRQRQLGDGHPHTAQSLNNLASLYCKLERYHEAEQLYIRSLAIREQYLGVNHLQTATSLSNLAFLYQSMERYSEAESFYTRSLAIRAQHLGANHPKTQQVRLNFLDFLKQVVNTGQVNRLSDYPLTQALLQKMQR
jgi:tetratricopeptide (TPR) repeat protein